MNWRLFAVLAVMVIASGCATIPQKRSLAAEMWLTTADGSQKLAPQPPLTPVATTPAVPAIFLDPTRRFQRMHGFGAAMTDASAELVSKLAPRKRRAMMAELFSRKNGGLGLSFTRLTVGASDFSRTHYSYDDTPSNVPDVELRYFSIEPARKYVLPRIREALAINPDLKVMISPWSAPAWMKTSKNLIKGQLVPEYYAVFARYLARTVEAFAVDGVPVAMLTIQNEPDFEPDSYPGMRVNSPERALIIGRFVGPEFKARRLNTEILDYDHNWDNPEMPLAVLSDPAARGFVAGVAWHCYEGDVPAQSPVHDAFPDKDAWETECSGGEWSPKFDEVLGWMTDKLIIGATNNWSRGSLLWNLALDPAHGPHQGGCGDCRGVVTIDPATGAVIRNVEYYVLGHASRFVLPGAFRIGATAHDQGIEVTAFLNPDGSRVAVLHRKSGEDPVTILIDGQLYSAPLPKGSVATLRWPAPSRRQ